ncbi:hypothetical protein KP014_21065 [Paenibacillus sophorae]|uniref:Uncharacterized protein n=3 Tax=Paenibacillus sophorae TaxID=1333845 RepID=A0ABX8H846_9BACL|nr:hypothetical protein [Paenibacillus sophorae]QWU14401.1 hypothetical protein KP014_21065 [Paenibacillus sophorae]
MKILIGVDNMARFTGVELSAESIQKAREWFADNAQGCINEVVSGEVKVNDIESYIQWRKESIAEALDGCYDYTLAFLQKAHTIQTGECVALLP